MSIEKQCFKCLCFKTLSEFYKHPAMFGGLLNKCKDCTRRDVREYSRANPDKVRQVDRSKRGKKPWLYKQLAKRWVLNNREKSRKIKEAWSRRNQDKRKASNTLNNAIRDGKIHKKPCQRCGCLKTHGHHEDYSKPLDVIWLCAACHARLHQKKRDLQRERRYDRASND